MKTLAWTFLLAALSLAAPLSAQLKGKPAPDFSAGESVTAKQDHRTLADCKAEVVLIKLWGVK